MENGGRSNSDPFTASLKYRLPHSSRPSPLMMSLDVGPEILLLRTFDSPNNDTREHWHPIYISVDSYNSYVAAKLVFYMGGIERFAGARLSTKNVWKNGGWLPICLG